MRNLAPFVRRPLAMTPLIDVIFLLLLFFMLTSTFSKYGEIELSAATTGGATSDTPQDRAFVQLGTDRLDLNGTPVTFEDLTAQVTTGQVLVSLDPDTTAQRLVDLLVLLRGRDGLSVLVLE
ncbi:Biopolymer transport protein ExbD/TolR [Ruegeria denitrificans]|uniref:Biopolymer transport protein ExbD/TolR n=1 Tax=Ruegeria denitrificans TaxID=1715692 RepID=A0A0N7MA76_9RHOB|nr:biopolymer transporter ExbD [Ruegeria denitrificans]CUK08248.1 Biopolymer transport protein ExbD/TolR [Ruegeria denitrificans]